MRRSHLLGIIVVFVSLASPVSARGIATQSESEQPPGAVSDLPEFRIGVADDRLDVPDDILVGYFELEAQIRIKADVDADGELAPLSTSDWIFALHLVRVLASGNVPDFFDSPDSERSIVGSEFLTTEPIEVTPEMLVTLEHPRTVDVRLELVRVPDSVAFDDLASDIRSDAPTFDWLADAYRPGLPVAQPDGEPAQAVVPIPFTFPRRATYLLYSPDNPAFVSVFQAVAVRIAPGCDPDYTVSTSTGVCDPTAGGVRDDDQGGPTCGGTDVTAHISRDSIALGCAPLELGKQNWAVLNTTDQPRTFSIYRGVPADTTIDQLGKLLASGTAGEAVLEELGIERLAGLTAFSGEESREVIVTLHPGSYAAVSTADDGVGDVALDLFELSD